MAKSLLYRLFGLGKMPAELAATLQGEGVILMDEGIKGSVTYLDFRAPGRRADWRRQWFTATIALTEARLLALQNSNTAINVPLRDERMQKMKFSVEDDGALLISFDPALFHSEWSGTMEYRFKTEQAQSFLDKVRERTV
ncbi:MAG TPA: hypothetical protein VF779_09440 [Pyrinomonadaceae bacterium]